MSIKRRGPLGRGDTIVEVLLAIAIASFGVGITYATAQRSLHQSITAREHNQALNYIENQITDLRLRYQNSSSSLFNNNFAYGSAGNLTNHFCLNDQASSPTSSNWLPIANDSSASESSPLASSAAPNAAKPYNNSCVRTKAGDGVTYYVDIQTTKLSGVTVNPTLYQVFVRWERSGGGQNNQSSTFYRINGNTATAPFGPGGGGQSCSGHYNDVVLTMDTSESMFGARTTAEKAAATQMVDSLNPMPGGNRVGAIHFDNAAYLLQNLTTNTAALKNSINSMTNTAGTNFGFPLDMDQVVLAGASVNTKVVVFMTDGLPDWGPTNAQIVAETTSMESSGIIIYTIGIQVGSGTPAETLLTDMAGGTNGIITGHYASVDNLSDFNSVLQSLAGTLTCS